MKRIIALAIALVALFLVPSIVSAKAATKPQKGGFSMLHCAYRNTLHIFLTDNKEGGKSVAYLVNISRAGIHQDTAYWVPEGQNFLLFKQGMMIIEGRHFKKCTARDLDIFMKFVDY